MTAEEILHWAKNVEADWPRSVEIAGRLAEGLRVRAVYREHRDQLTYMSDQRTRYNTVNRNVMTRALRKLRHDMEIALGAATKIVDIHKE